MELSRYARIVNGHRLDANTVGRQYGLCEAAFDRATHLREHLGQIGGSHHCSGQVLTDDVGTQLPLQERKRRRSI